MSVLACVLHSELRKKSDIKTIQPKDGVTPHCSLHITPISVTMTNPSQTPSSTTDSSE